MRYFIRIMLSLFFGTSLISAEEATQAFQWTIGEVLTYNVKWSFIHLGKLRLQVCDTLRLDQKKVYHTRLYLDSNPLLFFVNMHSVFESYIDEDFYPHLFLAEEKIDGVKYDTQYRFDYDRNLIEVRMTDIKDTTHIIENEIPLNEKVQDGMSLIFFARGNLDSIKQHHLIAFSEGKKGDLLLRMKGRGEKIEIDAIDAKLKTYKVDGTASFKAIAGFTGDYQGWFAVDAQRPPLKAKMKVFIGYINLELESWENWKPSVPVN